MRTTMVLVITLMMVAATGVPSATASGNGVSGVCRALRSKLAAEVKDLKTPGAAVLVRSPKIGNCYLSFGSRSLGSEEPIGPDDQFRIGSNTKTMTGTVILQLVQEKKLRLDDPISKFVDGVPDGDNITIEQLLNMRSGIADYSGLPAITEAMDTTPQRVWTPDELLALSYAEPRPFAPGQGYLYSNANTTLLGLTIEHITGKALAQVLDERIFRPLGLRHTLLPAQSTSVIPDTHSQGYIFGTATAFAAEGGGILSPDQAAAADAGTLVPNDVTDINPSWGWAAGAGISSTNDLARYVKALGDGELLSKKMQRQRLASVLPVDPTKPDGTAYGQAIVKYSGKLYGHTGELPGYYTFMGYDPKRDITVIEWANLLAAPDGRIPGAVLSQSIIDELYPT